MKTVVAALRLLTIAPIHGAAAPGHPETSVLLKPLAGHCAIGVPMAILPHDPTYGLLCITHIDLFSISIHRACNN